MEKLPPPDDSELAGGVWSGLVCLVAEPDDCPADVVGGVIDCERRAQRVLGLGHDEALDLFNPNDGLGYIDTAVRELCERAEVLSAARDVDHEARLRAELHAAVDHIDPKDTPR